MYIYVYILLDNYDDADDVHDEDDDGDDCDDDDNDDDDTVSFWCNVHRVLQPHIIFLVISSVSQCVCVCARAHVCVYADACVLFAYSKYKIYNLKRTLYR